MATLPWPSDTSRSIALPLRDVLPYIGDGAIEELERGRSRVRLGAWSWAALAALLLRFDADLARVEPTELRDAFRELTARAAEAPYPLV